MRERDTDNNMIKTGENNLRHLHYQQTVEFTGQEDQHSVELCSTNVTIVPSPGGHDHGSSKVKLKNIVDFTWEHNLYTGQLLAVHVSGKYLAYGIKVGSGSGVVRVVHKELEHRALLRGMRGAIQDLAFAHVSNVVLACIDNTGSLFIHTIEPSQSELLCSLVIQVEAKDALISHRVIWCPYIPEDDATDGDEVSKLLVLTRGSKVELWSIATVASMFRSIEATNMAVKESGGMMEIEQHSGTIVEATFSPDGTALATASTDGEVKFFQVFLHNNSHNGQPQPRCLHQWRPHAGRAISCLFFLDDHKNYHPDVQFWRFAVTGCDNNSELKVWSCEMWSCLQTIKFAPTPSTGKMPVLKAGLDLSAGYLLLSDIYNKVLYILSLSKDRGEALACVSTVSEFLLPYPILSFGIVDADQRKIRPSGESLEDLCPMSDEEIEDQLIIRMYLVQPKSLQECHIAFKPAAQVSGNCLLDTLIHDSLDYSEDLPDMGTANHNGIPGKNCDEERSLSATIEAAINHNTGGLNLMTPDAFSSPSKKENNELESNTASPELGKVISSSPSLAQAVQALNASDPPLATSEMEEQAPASSGSSPSREVREILSCSKPDEETETDCKPETKTNADEDWSNIPMVLLKDVSVHAMQEAEEFPEDDENNVQRKKTKDEPKTTSLSTDNTGISWSAHNEINNLELKLAPILEIIQNQNQELKALRAEVSRLQQESPVFTRVESTLARMAQQQNATLEQTLYSQMTHQREFLNTFETTIKDKIETSLSRVVEETVEPLKHQIQLDVNLMDDLLKKNVTELINGPHIKDSLALAAANAAKPALDAAFKESFATVILPGIEKTCQAMFKQIQDAFVMGTREYLQSIDAIIDKQCQRRNEQLSEALSTLVREELQTELNRNFRTMQDGTIRAIRDSIRENLSQQLSDISSVRSRATTPAIPVAAIADAQARIMSHLQKGQYNAAFQQALSASDLGLVVLVCERTEPSTVFSCAGAQGSRCILQQPVILSLVQQLSADLGHRTELKHRWLEDAILNLDVNDPVTREHIGTVLMTLQNQLGAFLASNPNHRSARRMKMLAMAARALLSQHP
ncbi:enhancer of mRNA-decapping protein 4 [Odontomachus brunneus]|uniref:enhancer of mRNA-decapping protein 4 n=1 Tax=Odontomachus brunneus TaxID=486640 RepID=UPI0013F1F1FA|nr:enhancer of mRNA-decapping protein 4 [Odontomachus brunneus]